PVGDRSVTSRPARYTSVPGTRWAAARWTGTAASSTATAVTTCVALTTVARKQYPVSPAARCRMHPASAIRAYAPDAAAARHTRGSAESRPSPVHSRAAHPRRLSSRSSCRSQWPSSRRARTRRAACQRRRSRPDACPRCPCRLLLYRRDLSLSWRALMSCGCDLVLVAVHLRGGAKALGANEQRIVAGFHEERRHRLHERRWTADEHMRHLRSGPAHLAQHRGVNAAIIAGPPRGRRPCERKRDLDVRVRGELLELRAVDEVIPRACRIEEPHRYARAIRGARVRVMPQHRHERHDAGPAGHEEERAALRKIPHEVAADRPAQLEPVAHLKHIAQIWRHLGVVETLDGERDVRVLGRRGNGVRALRLIAILADEAHVHVLAGAVTGPVWNIEHERARARC